MELPVFAELEETAGLGLDAVGMHLPYIARSPVTLESRNPYNPVVDIRIEPCHLTFERIIVSLRSGETYARIVRQTLLRLQFRIAARHEIKVIEGREAEVTAGGSFQTYVALAAEKIVCIQGRNQRSKTVTVEFLPQRRAKTQPLGRLPLYGKI